MLSPLDIKIELLRRGLTAAELGRRANVDRSAITHTISNRKRSRRLRRLVAEAIGLSYEAVWGEPESAGRRPGWLKGRPRKKAA